MQFPLNPKPSSSYSNVNLIPSPTQLLSRLQHIKSSCSTQKKKQIKLLQQNLQYYQRYCLSSLQHLQTKIMHINNQVNEIKKTCRKTQNKGVQKFDLFQKLLAKTLEQYQNQRKQGEKMVNQLVDNIHRQLQRTVIQKSHKSSQVLQKYLSINNRLQSIIASISSMQRSILSQYQTLQSSLRSRFSIVQQSLIEQIQQLQEQHSRFIYKIQAIQKQCQQKIQQLNDKKQKKRYQLHEIMQKMIEEIVGEQEGLIFE